MKAVKVRKKRAAWGWGIFLLLIAAVVLANNLGGFLELGIWSIIVATLAVAFMVQCIVDLSFGSLPIPLAALYFIFQTPLGLPEISFWPLVLVTLLATAGLYVLLPKRRFRLEKEINYIYSNNAATSNIHSVNGNARIVEGEGDNNPRINVQFGSISRYLRADSLETAVLDCSFGSLEVYFDDVELSPNGAEAFINCKFGAVEMYVPSHWRILDNMDASLGGVDVKGSRRMPAEDAPTLKLNGTVSLGGVEVHRL